MKSRSDPSRIALKAEPESMVSGVEAKRNQAEKRYTQL